MFCYVRSFTSRTLWNVVKFSRDSPLLSYCFSINFSRLFITAACICRNISRSRRNLQSSVSATSRRFRGSYSGDGERAK
ncbi:hypothetical protein PUN28_006981 [Cardiocondyla obscurior]|uniref:Uncharacterized protein n=1 Tax=Cardiocondyla obscurior TaxID=286306 RepID=A0AAW2G350_9HYME